MKRVWIILILLISLLAGAIFWFGTPRLQSFSPSNEAADIPGRTRLQLNFSRTMRPETVQERLSIKPNIPGTFTWQGKTLEFTPQNPWSPGTTVEVTLEKGARASGLLQLPILTDSGWKFTIRQPRLLYLYPSDQAANIYQYDPASGENIALTNLLPGILEFDANQDGTAIYYSIQNNLGGSDIYRLSLDDSLAGQVVQVLACQKAQCRAPQISQDEEYLAYELTPPIGEGEVSYPQVWFVALPAIDADSKPVSDLEAKAQLAGDKLHQTLQPDWSSGNQLSFYDTNQQAFVILDPVTGSRQTFMNQTGEPGSWHPAGDAYVAPEIFFNEGGNPETTPELRPVASSHLLQFNLANSSIQDLTELESLEDTSPAFSPDGKTLAFARKYLDISRWTPGRQLWVMSADGTDQKQLTDQPNFNHFSFSWDPTGTKIAFVRFDQTAPTNLPVIWEIDLQSGVEFELVIGAYSPHWIP